MKELEFVHTPTSIMPDNGYPYRLYCPKCGKTTVACEKPISKDIQKKLKGTPCSECVSPIDYFAKLRR